MDSYEDEYEYDYDPEEVRSFKKFDFYKKLDNLYKSPQFEFQIVGRSSKYASLFRCQAEYDAHKRLYEGNYNTTNVPRLEPIEQITTENLLNHYYKYRHILYNMGCVGSECTKRLINMIDYKVFDHIRDYNLKGHKYFCDFRQEMDASASSLEVLYGLDIKNKPYMI